MASSSRTQLPLLILLTLLFSLRTHARDSQFFNKVPSTTNNNVVNGDQTTTQLPNKDEQPLRKDQESATPAFIPQTDNAYGLYGHESGQLPPSTTTARNRPQTEVEPLHRGYLPDNYNPVAYVTKPEGYKPDSSLSDNGYDSRAYADKPAVRTRNNYYNNDAYLTDSRGSNDDVLPQNYNTEAYVTEPRRSSRVQRTYNDEPFVSGPQDVNDASYARFADRGFSGVTGSGRFAVQEKQGMSDTRFLENGKYYYDANEDKYSRNPYENARGADYYSRSQPNSKDRVFYGNYNGNKSMQTFQNEDDEQFFDSQDNDFP